MVNFLGHQNHQKSDNTNQKYHFYDYVKCAKILLSVQKKHKKHQDMNKISAALAIALGAVKLWVSY